MSTPLESLRILVVDDEKNMHSLIDRIVAPLMAAFPGSTVVFKTKWSEALLEIAMTPTPDVMVLDLKLSDIDLRHKIKEIKEADEKLPVVVVSAAADDAQLRDIRSLGIETLCKDASRNFIDLMRGAIVRAILRGRERRMNAMGNNIMRIREILTLLEHGPA